jgi:hypothetical protein
LAKIVLVKNDQGKLEGHTEPERKRYAKFLAHAKSMAVGDTIAFEFKVPRSLPFHRRHFGILKMLFESQEQFDSQERLREWLEVGAGFCDILPGPKGKPVALARSIAWEALEQADFEAHHNDVIAFMRTPHCYRFLWPHLEDVTGSTMIETILMEFGA